MPEQFGEKSHPATAHRRRQAREKGNVVQSQDLTSAALLLIAGLALKGLGGRVARSVGSLMRDQLGGEAWVTLNHDSWLVELRRVSELMAYALLPVLGVLFVGAIAIVMGQIGFLFLPQRLGFQWQRISPAQGIKRIISWSGAMRLSFGLFKVIIIACTAALVVAARFDLLMGAAAMSLPAIAWLLGTLLVDTIIWVAAALLILAAGDYAFQRWKYENELRMTTEEIREEMKTLQGDPQVIARRKQIQRQMVLNRISSGVPKSDFVVTNPTELAVAVQYDPLTMAAPVVVAKGAGVLAAQIRKLALENDIPVIENKPLARSLYAEVEINHPVPDKSYAAVAEVLAYVYQLKGKKLPGQAA